MNAGDLAACSFEQWYPRHQSHTFRSRVLNLSPEFVQYLLADGVFLPDADQVYPTRAGEDPHADEDDYQRWPEEDETAEGEEDGTSKSPAFPELEAEIRAAIDELGGQVVPKLNWSCPKDATWVSTSQSLCCSTPGDVFLLLKSSDRVSHDLAGAWDAVSDGREDSRGDEPAGTARPAPVLALREHFDLQPWMEFRCFVKDRKVIGVCQRDVTAYFTELQGREDDIADAVLTFHEQHVQGTFPLDDYVMDVFVSKRMRVYIMDFNPVGGTTQALLFEWEELPYSLEALAAGSAAPGGSGGQPWAEGEVDVRFITQPVAIRPGARAAYGVPYDLVDTSQGSAIDELIKSMQQAAGASGGSDDDDDAIAGEGCNNSKA
mmetsp:Transcript_29442/g.83022  ORF Transcript_29442/g.83022 Transcript_29442/m.83022 type:complete len:376 (+) Transcript_29442:188-1315(+)